MPATFTELLAPTKSAPVQVIRWDAADPDAAVEPGQLPPSGTLTIESKRDHCRYLVTEFPTPMGRAFRMVKSLATPGTDTTEESYDILIANPQDHVCSCKGHQRWGHCKHSAAMLELIAQSRV